MPNQAGPVQPRSSRWLARAMAGRERPQVASEVMVIVHDIPVPGAVAGSQARPARSDADAVRFTARDIAGLALVGDMNAASYDLLASALGVTADRLRAITARWRRAGRAETRRIGPGPAWCWLTQAGIRAAGLRFPARRPPLARLAHIRAVLAVRIGIEAGQAYRNWRGVVAQRAAHPVSRRAPESRARAGRGGAVAGPARRGLRGGDLGDRGRTDGQARRPHDRDHERAAGQDDGMGAGIAARPGAEV